MRTPEHLARVIRRSACGPPPTLTLPHEEEGDDLRALPPLWGRVGWGGELHLKRALPCGRISVILAALWVMNITSRVVDGAVDVDVKDYRPDCGVTMTQAE